MRVINRVRVRGVMGSGFGLEVRLRLVIRVVDSCQAEGCNVGIELGLKVTG